MTFFDQNPPVARRISTSAHGRARTRSRAQSARKQSAKAHLTWRRACGKLADCSERDPELTELTSSRRFRGVPPNKVADRRYQAILPIRGKLIMSRKRAKINF